MEYPLELSSSAVGLDVSITDASGTVIFRSDGSSVFAGGQRTQPSYRVKSEKLMSLSPRCHIMDLGEKPVCTLRRDNVMSLWKSRYSVLIDGRLVVMIREGKTLGKTLGGLFEDTPLAEASSRAWSPAFVVARPDSTVIMHLEKRRSIQGRFTVKKQTELGDSEERVILLSLFGLVLLERIYG